MGMWCCCSQLLKFRSAAELSEWYLRSLRLLTAACNQPVQIPSNYLRAHIQSSSDVTALRAVKAAERMCAKRFPARNPQFYGAHHANTNIVIGAAAVRRGDDRNRTDHRSS